MRTTFEVGDRVKRRENVFNLNSKIMVGTVCRVQTNVPPKPPITGGSYKEVYDVYWDKNGLKRGYLPHGLDRL
jgi:hypothetical protein